VPLPVVGDTCLEYPVIYGHADDRPRGMLLPVRHAASLLNYCSPQTRSSIRARNGEFLIDRNELRLKKSYPVISCAAIRRSTNEDKNVARGRPLDGERCLGVDFNHGGNLCRRLSMFCGARTDKNRRKLTKFVSEAEMLVTSSSPPPPVLLAGDKTRVVGWDVLDSRGSCYQMGNYKTFFFCVQEVPRHNVSKKKKSHVTKLSGHSNNAKQQRAIGCYTVLGLSG
jgi:hypothetical protein